MIGWLESLVEGEYGESCHNDMCLMLGWLVRRDSDSVCPMLDWLAEYNLLFALFEFKFPQCSLLHSVSCTDRAFHTFPIKTCNFLKRFFWALMAHHTPYATIIYGTSCSGTGCVVQRVTFRSCAMTAMQLLLYMYASLCSGISGSASVRLLRARKRVQCRMPVSEVQYCFTCSTQKVHAQCARVCVFWILVLTSTVQLHESN